MTTKPLLSRSLLATVGAMLLLVHYSAGAQSLGTCRDTSTVMARGLRNHYGMLVSVTDTQAVRVRTQLSLPALANTQVRLVADTAVCRIASQAYDSVLGVTDPATPVIVIEVGSKRIVIKDPELEVGRILSLIFDQNFGTLLQRVLN